MRTTGAPARERTNMAHLTAAERKRIPSQDFAVPSKAPRSGSYPIPDASHARDALARSSGKPVAAKVRAAVKRKFPGIKQHSDRGRMVGLASAMGA
jgi:hypothetical protein